MSLKKLFICSGVSVRYPNSSRTSKSCLVLYPDMGVAQFKQMKINGLLFHAPCLLKIRPKSLRALYLQSILELNYRSETTLISTINASIFAIRPLSTLLNKYRPGMMDLSGIDASIFAIGGRSVSCPYRRRLRFSWSCRLCST